MSEAAGRVPWYLVFAVVTSTAVGVGTYVVIRDVRRASLSPEAPVRAEPITRPAPVAAPIAEPVAAPVPEPVPDVAVGDDEAERAAVDPAPVEDPSKDKVQFGTPGVGGGLSRAAVERTIKRYTVRYERCARRVHESYRLRSATIRLMMTIDPAGVVSQLGSRSALQPELTTCVIDVIRKLRFDKSPDGTNTRVIYPILFWRADDGDAVDTDPDLPLEPVTAPP